MSVSHNTAPGVRFIFSTVHKFKGLEEETVRLLGKYRYYGPPTKDRNDDDSRREVRRMIVVSCIEQGYAYIGITAMDW